MKERCKLFLSFLILCCSISIGYAQIESFSYRIEIKNAKKGWNAINLPLEIYGEVKNDLSDIRIYQTDKNTEQPFIIDIQTAKNERKKADFKIINPTQTNDLYSYAFELSNKIDVNKIHLEISNKNFDWEIHLEGSMNQNLWSTIVKKHRIVTINNRETNFSYTDIPLPTSKFNFYKISFRSTEKPILTGANILLEESSKSNFKTYPIHQSNQKEDKESKSTTIELDLGLKVPVSNVEIYPNDSNDYYRPIYIEGLVDSFKTEKGWNYRYDHLYRGTLNSFSKNNFSFASEFVRKIKITISNFDNQPLSYEKYIIKGPNHRIIVRLENSDNLQLVYGNKSARKPIYDLSFFIKQIPANLNYASLGETRNYKKESTEQSPLFKNKWWLWTIILIVIALLGTFTVKMLKEEK